MVGYSVKPDVALIVDVAQATDIPVTNKKRFGETKIGHGPTLSRGSVNHPAVDFNVSSKSPKERS